MIVGTYLNGNAIVVRASDGASVPCDEQNADYCDLMAAVSAGDEIAPYVAPSVDLKTVAADKRWQVETGGITVSGAAIPTDRASQAMITGAVAFAQLNSDASIDFKAGGGFVTLTAAQMIAVGQAVGAHVQACFAAEKAIDADIDAGTITTAAQVDEEPRWP
ncbi:MAG: DUF4376 domain-containing protein [Devosia sp.]|nr:DUF4376 domain-containing protein [Devosia sp.]